MLGRGASTGGTATSLLFPLFVGCFVPFLSLFVVVLVCFSWVERFAFGLKPVRTGTDRACIARSARLSSRGTGFASTSLFAIDRRASETIRSYDMVGERAYDRLGTMF